MSDSNNTALIRLHVPYPETVETLLSQLREWFSTKDVREVIIRPGRPVLLYYNDSAAEDGPDYYEEVGPFDVLLQGGELIRVDNTSAQMPVEAMGVVFRLFEALLEWGKHPRALFVASRRALFTLFGISGVRATKSSLFGVDVIEDHRVPDDTLILAGTSHPDDGFGSLVYGVFTILDGLGSAEEGVDKSPTIPAGDLLRKKEGVDG